MSPSNKPQAPRWGLPILAALAALCLALQGFGVGGEAEPVPIGPAVGAQAIIAVGAITAIWALGWLARALLSRREDHYLEDVEDGDLP